MGGCTAHVRLRPKADIEGPFQCNSFCRYDAQSFAWGAVMRRREFITILGGAAATWPLAAYAQQPTGRLAWIGLLMPVSATSAANNIGAMREGLRDLGYIEGQNIAIEYRYTDGRDDLHAGFAAELVRRKVDVIVTWGTQSARAAKQATGTIPIVMAAIADPIGTGIVSNLARPGENVTGLSSTALDIEAKRLELLKEVVPKAARTGVFWNPGNPVSSLISSKRKRLPSRWVLSSYPSACGSRTNSPRRLQQCLRRARTP